MPTFLRTPSRPPNPVQWEPTPAPQATRIIDWMARLASETPNGFFVSYATTTAAVAPAMYGPDATSPPSSRRLSCRVTSTKCQGWRLLALAERWPGSTIRRSTSSGIGLFLDSRAARDVGAGSEQGCV